jgi:small subunit ribosomal protein S2
MKRFILTERNGIYIIDLGQTLSHIDAAYQFVRQTVARGGSVLFVGTKKQAQEAVQEQATRVGMPYVNQRWLGGMLTNFQTISKRLSRLKELEDMNLEDGQASSFTKKERLMMSRERDKLSRTLGGIRSMGKLPSAVWIVDTKKEHLAVDEARKLGIPIIAILDTNADPDEVEYAVPGNDDAIRSVGLLTRVLADGVAEGLRERHALKDDQTGEEEVTEPLAEWEQELLNAPGAETATSPVAPAVEVAAEVPAPVTEPAVTTPEPVPATPVEPTAADRPAEDSPAAAPTPAPAVVADQAGQEAPENPVPPAEPTPAPSTKTVAEATEG